VRYERNEETNDKAFFDIFTPFHISICCVCQRFPFSIQEELSMESPVEDEFGLCAGFHPLFEEGDVSS